MAIDKQPLQSEPVDKPEVSNTTETGTLSSGKRERPNDQPNDQSDKPKKVSYDKAQKRFKKEQDKKIQREQNDPQYQKSKERFQKEKEILSDIEKQTDEKDRIYLTNEYWHIINFSNRERLSIPAHIEAVRGTFTGKTEKAILSLPIPEIEEIGTELPEPPTYQALEKIHYQKIGKVKEIFDQRSQLIRVHLVDEILGAYAENAIKLSADEKTGKIPDIEKLFKVLLNSEDQDDFFQNITKLVNAITINDKNGNEVLTRVIETHRSTFETNQELTQFKVKRLDKEFVLQVNQISKDVEPKAHSEFLKGLQDALDHFRQSDNPADKPIVALLEQFKEQTQAVPGEEIIKAVRKMYILTTFDKESAGATYKSSFTLTRGLVLGIIKNYWERSGENIVKFQDNLKKWWIHHVNRPTVNENGEVNQEVKNKMINSEKGSYYSRFSLSKDKLDHLRNIDQVQAIAIMARQQLLSTLQNEGRNNALDIMDGWTHTDMPLQQQYSIVVHKGNKFKKLIFTKEELHGKDIDQNKEEELTDKISPFIESFTRQFDQDEGWFPFEPDDELKNKALSGETTIQEAQKRKFIEDDPSSADTSLVLLKDDDSISHDDVIQRGMQSWTHGSGIKFSLTLFVGEDGKLTGEGAQKGSHSWTDGRVSSLKLEHMLEESDTLYQLMDDPDPKTGSLDVTQLNNGENLINEEQEAKLRTIEISREKYQKRVQKLYEFFKSQDEEGKFNFDINALISASILHTLNNLWQMTPRKGALNNIQFLEKADFSEAGMKIGESLTPVPLQYNDKMQKETRDFIDILNKSENKGKTIEEIAQLEDIPLHEAKRKLQKVVLSFAFFDKERQVVRSGDSGIIAVMSEMAGDYRNILTKISSITSKELTDMATGTVLLSSLVPAIPRLDPEKKPDDNESDFMKKARKKAKKDSGINITSFSTAMDEVYDYFGFVIAASSHGQEENEKISIVLRQMDDVVSEGLANINGDDADNIINFEDLVEENMDRVLTMLEKYQELHELQEQAA
ncbi:MAG: hypothetical protein OEX81_01475 [Candidatus Pacebacteria bacterium]|nr:hypothetical protein [Candidatus Paceibacterota bacterium]